MSPRPLHWCLSVSSGALDHGEAATLDYTSQARALLFGRASLQARCRIVGAVLATSGGSGPVLVDEMRAHALDLGARLALPAGVYVPLDLALPDLWDGALAVGVTSALGSTQFAWLTLQIRVEP